MNNNEIIEKALDWRYACKRFNPAKKINESDWNTLTSSLIMAPSSYGLQPWKFLVIQDIEIREKLKPFTWGQSQVTDASHYIVFVTKEGISEEDVQSYLCRISEVRGIALDSLKGFRDMLMKNVVLGKEGAEALAWTQRQAYIAMGFLLESAALLNIDTTPIEGLEPSNYDKILKLEGSGWKTVAAVALGYRHDDDVAQSNKKVRFKRSDVITYI